MENLIYSSKPAITIATNTFINIPVILRIDDINIIEMVEDVQLGFTTSMNIFNSDGVNIAKVKGTRIYPTDAGKDHGLQIDKLHDTWVGKLDGSIIFENKVENGELFKLQAELYSPTGYLFKATNVDGVLLNQNGIQIGGISMRGNVFDGGQVGIYLTTK